MISAHHLGPENMMLLFVIQENNTETSHYHPVYYCYWSTHSTSSKNYFFRSFLFIQLECLYEDCYDQVNLNCSGLFMSFSTQIYSVDLFNNSNSFKFDDMAMIVLIIKKLPTSIRPPYGKVTIIPRIITP